MELQALPPFDPDPAETAASRWERYLKRFDNYVVAKGITHDARKKCLLLHVAGEYVFDVADALTDEELTYAALKTKLNEHFAPKRNVEYEIFMFRQASQETGENIDKYHARLRHLAKSCEFHDADREIKSQIVQRCTLSKVRDKGLAEPDVTLDKLLKFGRTLEATEMQARAMSFGREQPRSQTSIQSGSRYPEQAACNKLQQHFRKTYSAHSAKAKVKPKERVETGKNRNNKVCPGCGGHHQGRRETSCKAWGAECFSCHGRNHFSSVCRKNPSGRSRNNFVRTEAVGANETPADSDPYNASLYRTDAKGVGCVKPYVCDVELNGVNTTMEVDTGAASTVISEKQFSLIRRGHRNLVLSKDGLPKLRMYSGACLHPTGRVMVEVKHDDQARELPLLVVPGNGPCLLGRDWLELLHLNWSRVHHLDQEDFARQFPELFKDEIGTLRGVEAKLHVTKDATVRCFKARPVPYALREKVDAELDRLLEDGVIKPVEFSDYAAPIVPVLRANGRIRICGDYKLTVNKVVLANKHPIPNIEDLYAKLAGGKLYSRIDLRNAYEQILLSEESQKLTTVTTSRGLFCYTRLCQGVSASPGIFQRLMEQLLQGIPMTAVYLDDIVCTGRTEEESRANLITVLGRLQTAGLRLKLDKCEFLQPSCIYLGHRLDAEGIHPTNEKVRVIADAPVPRDRSELKSYLGMVCYYHKFLHNLSAKLVPLHHLLQKDVAWSWGPAQQAAFEESKRLLQSTKVLVHYNPSMPLLLTCDSSAYGIGAVLSHRMPDGTDRPIAYASRSLSKAEKNYAQLEREGLALIYGVTKFHKYVYGRVFSVITDHRPLLGLLGEDRAISAMASARIQRWALTLANYQYHLCFRPGRKIANADGLSRLPVDEAPTEVPVPAEVVLSMTTLEKSPVTAAQVATWTRRDPLLAAVVRFVQQGWPDSPGEEYAVYFRRKEELSVQAGCLMWGSRVIIPTPGREAILSELHECHPGIVRMKAVARSFLWWPGINDEILAKVRACEVCQQQRNAPHTAQLHPWEWPGQPWHRIHVDYAGPMDGKMVLVIVDAHSKYIDAHIMNAATSSATITKLRQTFATHGLPSVLVSDNASRAVNLKNSVD